MKVDSPLPSFEGATEWLNQATPNAHETIGRKIKGRPTLVHFWSINSEVSKINLAHLAELRSRGKRDGLGVIAVHIPQSEEEKDAQRVREAMAKLHLTEPCALDNEHKLSDAFSNEPGFVPAYYLFDIEGRLRSFSAEANGLDVLEDQLHQMLADLRARHPFCPECELYLNDDAMFCSDCGLPLILPGSHGTHPYYENHYAASLPTVRLVNPDPLIGHTIEGKYELTARLGEGGMSVVYRARRIHIGDDVAVKILLGRFAKSDAALTRFRREARAAAMVHHPNVITIHDFGEAGDDNAPAFLVMEFVKGTPLRDLLNSKEHFSVERTVRLMRGICAGAGAAHKQEVVHRDLKPENILVVAPNDDYEFESVKVIDFGLAKLVADASSWPTVTVVGTPYYMSPEQCMGEPLDARSDVYSLGAMFYEMLSGERPFASETVSGIVNKHLYEEVPPLGPSLKIPRRISAAIMQALAKNPDDRQQTASDLARQLV
ncbi:MAG TPA: protein kinase [Pyrinomonadaceae bacterium]|nr:protein kinase [Pyrinomonadaceae bacterium]